MQTLTTLTLEQVAKVIGDDFLKRPENREILSA